MANENTFKHVSKELWELLEQAKETSNKALDECAELVADRLVAATPIGNDALGNRKHTRDSWVKELKYNNVKFIFNTAVNNNNIPILNLLEFGSKGHPFAIQTFRNSFKEMNSIIERELKKVE